MAKSLKKHKSISEQIDLLESRGVKFENRDYASEVLSNINYYRLTGYLFEFRSKKCKDKYAGDITFEHIVELYNFDCKLTRILMYALENVEETFKTRFSYILSKEFPNDPEIYLKGSIYRNEDELKKFKRLFRIEKKNNLGLPFIKHHVDCYGGRLPIWVAVEILTMGNLRSLYNNLCRQYQKEIAEQYNTGVPQMKNWLENITYTRNHLAHYMRIYSYNFGRTYTKCKNHLYVEPTGKIFDQIVVMGYMFSDKEDWKSYVIPEIKEVIEAYSEVIDLERIGFPDNWEEMLKSI